MDLFMLIFWIVLLVVLLIVEAATVQLVTIWFAIGAAAALIARICGAALWLQWVLFVVVSAVTLAATRPLVRKITKQKTQPTNADRCIGETAMVTEDIDNISRQGQGRGQRYKLDRSLVGRSEFPQRQACHRGAH